jgi:hypothetical protein
VLCHEVIWGSGAIAPSFFDFGTRWRYYSDRAYQLFPYIPKKQHPCLALLKYLFEILGTAYLFYGDFLQSVPENAEIEFRLLARPFPVDISSVIFHGTLKNINS